MSGGVQADYTTLTAAASVWSNAADDLDGAWRRLHRTSAAMDAGVAAAVEAFRETWVDEVKRVATRAQDHADSLNDAVRSYRTVDAAAFDRLHGLLPWGYRDSTIDPDGAPPPVPSPSPGPSPTPPGPSSTPSAPSSSPGPSPSPTPSPSASPSPTP